MEHQADISEVQSDGSELQNFRFLTPLTRNSPEELITSTWEKIRTQEYAFDDFSRNQPSLFLSGLISDTTKYFLVEDSGIVILQDLWKCSSPHIHFCMWDRNYPMAKIKSAAHEIIDWVFSEFECHRISAIIPIYNSFAKRLATTLRFRYEGTMKEAILYKGKWFDEDIFGLLQNVYSKREVN